MSIGVAMEIVASRQWLTENESIAVGIVGTVASIAGIWACYWAYRHSKQTKSLDYRIDNYAEIVVNSAAHAGTKLHMSWGDDLASSRPVLKPVVLTVRLANTGTIEIKEDEFYKPITIELPEGELIEATITAVSDPSIYALGPVPIEDGKRVHLAPALLNAGDSVAIQLTKDGGTREVLITSRIAGVRSIRDMQVIAAKNYDRQGRLFFATTVIGFFTVFGLSLGDGQGVLNSILAGFFVGVVVVFMFVFVMTFLTGAIKFIWEVVTSPFR